MTDIRKPTHEEIEALRPERLSTVGEARGWNVSYASGHAAGFAAGARAFAEWAWRDSGDIRIREYWDDLAARFLATRPELAGGTGSAVAPGVEDGEKEE
jgi:hypothetical protein